MPYYTLLQTDFMHYIIKLYMAGIQIFIKKIVIKYTLYSIPTSVTDLGGRSGGLLIHS